MHNDPAPNGSHPYEISICLFPGISIPLPTARRSLVIFLNIFLSCGENLLASAHIKLKENSLLTLSRY